MKYVLAIIYVFVATGCSSTSLVKSCNELDGKDFWTKIDKPFSEHSPIYENQIEIWLKNGNGKIAKCLSCEHSTKQASSFHYFENRNETEIIIRTCGTY